MHINLQIGRASLLIGRKSPHFFHFFNHSIIETFINYPRPKGSGFPPMTTERILFMKIMKKFLCIVTFSLFGIATLGVHPVSSANQVEEHIVEIQIPRSLPNFSNLNLSEDGDIGICTTPVNGQISVMYEGAINGRLRITDPDGNQNIFALPSDGEYHAYPCLGGNGDYQVSVLTYAGYDNIYHLSLSENANVSLNNPLTAYTMSNVWCEYDENSLSTDIAKQIAKENPSEEEFVDAVYDYITSNISYDTEKAGTVSYGYYPNVDETLTTQKGICVDYTAAMSAMLRCFGIPTKICFGYVNDAYHAWIEVYSSIRNTWVRYDPTAGANNKDIQKYVSNDSNYTTTHIY